MPGYIALDRNSFRALLNSFPKRLRCSVSAIWTEMLMRANWERGENSDGRDTVMLERGQLVLGRDELSALLGVSPRTIRTVLSWFQKRSELTSKTTNRGSILTIVNYDLYACLKKENDQENDQEPTNSRPKTDQKLTIKTTNRGSIPTIVNYDLYACLKKENDQENDQEPTNSRPKTDHSEEVKEVKELEHKSMSANADALAPKDREDTDVEKVSSYYKANIHPKSRLLKSGKTKVRARLNTFAASELIRAMENFRNFRDPKDGSAWWIENCAWRGFDWFFSSDKRIDQFLNLPANGRLAQSSPLNCPQHGKMTRLKDDEGQLVFRCRECDHHFQTGKSWTTHLQTWETASIPKV